MKFHLRQIYISAVLGIPAILFAQNPITPEGTFFSDPSARQWKDGKIYIYGSRDESSRYWCSYDNDVLSSSDMKHWKLHKNVFSSRGNKDEIAGTDDLLFASDCIYKDGIYYLLYCTPDRNHTEGVATSQSPIGPFRDGYKLEGCNQIDPSALIDDDGQIYYYWGQGSLKMAKMKPDFSGIDSTTFRDKILTNKEHYFHEGVQAFKRNGIYYLCFADESRRGRPTCLGYATATSPEGPFTYQGVIIDNKGCDPESWNNHGSVVEVDGKWYVFYHRCTNGQQTFRKACVEPITFDENGLIKEVEMTTSGTSGWLNPFKKTEARLACRMEGNVRISTLSSGQERLTDIHHQDKAEWKYFYFKQKPKEMKLELISRSGGKVQVYIDNQTDKDNLHLVGTFDVKPGDGKQMQVLSTRLSGEIASGKQGVVLRFMGDMSAESLFDIESFVFK